ncbi:F420-dependent glucose-6-phosphate dehydrogenase [Gemmata obscuriglobus]|uniref:Uncharacterized protein n=1 Tax=Gemmata obscuriglobus TaxID=114 RepID=A0A2Z3HB08_9BACT|nr:dehydrogenase [Gemmata obscuriglobus]AWM41562.1 hypothetical protein C1280_34210 [Gemmata obscuriglobus]QEG32523.1 F420-dependent glucose-6-phosphate dehydrogenase [Gemmata obscuriglobus]VTS11879.1 -methylene tetrahydromethanopterin reductase : Putative 5,10-methylenetetrahydromethanopterin reductase OS=Deinococcus deserti (strain VCD115 / DSM 17065 / LMG 22923) GN=Deide_3p02310 PE=4 SV=1 [Gemmata obscuriglobus UQM 2246]
MKVVGWHASHELYPPGELIMLVRRAEGAGMCSDNFHPWTPHQGKSGFAFTWFGAALQSATRTSG